jgi:4-hydroxy-tetrahydrodipicolinate reductase
LVWSGSARSPKDLKDLVAAQPDVVIDFSKPAGTLAWTQAFTKSKKLPAALVCATGFEDEDVATLEKILKKTAWALVPNTSLGVFAMAQSLKTLAKTLPDDYVFSIHESHHIKKVDAPSGTGLMLQKLLQGLRKSDVAISSVRGGTDPGTHTVTVLGPFEKISITHSAEDRKLFARGALILGVSLSKRNTQGRASLEDLM